MLRGRGFRGRPSSSVGGRGPRARAGGARSTLGAGSGRLDALWTRARPRDYHDVAALIDRFGRDRLLELAAEKDAGFTPQTFVDALTAIRRLSDADWTEDGIEPGSATALKPVFEQSNSDLRNASS